MAIINPSIAVLWFILILYRLASAPGAKRRIPENSRWRGIVFRLVVGAFLLLRLKVFHPLSHDLYLRLVPSNPALRLTGLMLCALGIAFALRARFHLGRNWGMPMSLQRDHELITTGPYSRVRHPIYTGILLAMLGSALAEGTAWLPFLLIFSAYFIYSARAEEKLMLRQFPQEYPAYQARTKMLVPFIW